MPIGWMAPAPTPCTSRNRIIDGIDQAKPHSSEPTRKIAMPDRITFLRPEQVGELAEHDGGRGLGQQERGEHPAIELQAAELADDLRHRGRDDRRLDGDHEIRRDHGSEHERAMGRKGGHVALHRGASDWAPIARPLSSGRKNGWANQRPLRAGSPRSVAGPQSSFVRDPLGPSGQHSQPRLSQADIARVAACRPEDLARRYGSSPDGEPVLPAMLLAETSRRRSVSARPRGRARRRARRQEPAR